MVNRAPNSAFSPCRDCDEQYMGLTDGLCPECSKKRRREADLESLRSNRERTLQRAGVPSRFARLSFRQPKAWPTDYRRPDLLLSQWNGEPWSVLLTGPPGTGKTSFAVELLFVWLCRPDSGRFIRAGDLPRIYFGGDALAFDQLKTVAFLAIDDLGRGTPGRAWEAVSEIVSARYDEEVATIITTNLGMEGIASHGGHMADRLTDGLVMRVSGHSRRGVTKW